MIKSQLVNAELLSKLAFLGHGDKILVVDYNYPLKSKSGDADKVYLSICKDMPDMKTMLVALQSAINLEKVEIMIPEDSAATEIFPIIEQAVAGAEIKRIKRFSFYDAACEPAVRLAISTGETRPYGCVLLTVGCVIE